MATTPTARKKKRNRAAQDVNLINLRALKKRVANLVDQVDLLWDALDSARSEIRGLKRGTRNA